MTLKAPKLLVYVDAIARLGSIRKAADAMNIASSALNRRLLELEDEVGTPLFERKARGVVLTPAGETYIAYVRRTLTDVDATRSHLAHLQGLVTGDVRIASAESIGTNLLPDVLSRFHEQHPGVRFHLTIGGTEMLLQALLDDRVELLIAHDPPRHPDLAVYADIAQPLYALMRDDHPLAQRSSLAFEECILHPYVLGAPTFGSRRLIDQFAAARGIVLEPRVVSNSVENLKAHTRREGAICFQFEAGVAHDPVGSGLVGVPLNDASLASGRLVMAARRGRFLAIAATTVAERLIAALADLREASPTRAKHA
jgi:DNA-binding transcriptional LysR family regulator